MNVAIIPARGGSKRIPYKNIREFCGKPIISYSIEAAISSGCFDRVIVSTDDLKIAEVAEKYGAEVPFVRPASISDDHTGTNTVVKHALQWLNNHQLSVEYACCIYATAPFIEAEYIRTGLDNVAGDGCQFSFSVTSFPFPVQRALRITDNGYIEPVNASDMLKRSQDLEERYHDAGQFYWGMSGAFLEDANMFACSSIPVIIPRYLVQDIDTMEDWMQAELMYKALHNNKAD